MNTTEATNATSGAPPRRKWDRIAAGTVIADTDGWVLISTHLPMPAMSLLELQPPA